jgi:soluble cytochrome b562
MTFLKENKNNIDLLLVEPEDMIKNFNNVLNVDIDLNTNKKIKGIETMIEQQYENDENIKKVQNGVYSLVSEVDGMLIKKLNMDILTQLRLSSFSKKRDSRPEVLQKKSSKISHVEKLASPKKKTTYLFNMEQSIKDLRHKVIMKEKYEKKKKREKKLLVKELKLRRKWN